MARQMQVRQKSVLHLMLVKLKDASPINTKQPTMNSSFL